MRRRSCPLPPRSRRSGPGRIAGRPSTRRQCRHRLSRDQPGKAIGFPLHLRPLCCLCRLGARRSRCRRAGDRVPVPTPSAGVNGITAGPDGALWFTESQKIARITTGGAITEDPVPSPPESIAAGPDGALWYTSRLNTIGRMTTTGQVTEYQIPTSLASPAGITAGPDGALSFHRVQRLEDRPDHDLRPDHRVPGAWFGSWLAQRSIPWISRPVPTVRSGSRSKSDEQIGRITTSGEITEYPPPAPTGFAGIASGPDGALWAAEPYTSSIARVSTSGASRNFRPGWPGSPRPFRHRVQSLRVPTAPLVHLLWLTQGWPHEDWRVRSPS